MGSSYKILLSVQTPQHIVLPVAVGLGTKMKSFTTAIILLLFCVVFGHSWETREESTSIRPECRNIPGSAGYPTDSEWDAFNTTISGRLVNVVPSAKYCMSLPGGACANAQWTSALFRATIPGAMNQVRTISSPIICLPDSESYEGQLGAGEMKSAFAFS